MISLAVYVLLSEQLESESVVKTRVLHVYSCQQTLEKVKSILERDNTSSLQDQHLENVEAETTMAVHIHQKSKIFESRLNGTKPHSGLL